MLKSLFNSFENIIIFDVETTGLDPKQDEIIEIALLKVVNRQESTLVENEYDMLVKLAPDKRLPDNITNMTGITDQQLQSEGVGKDKVCGVITDILSCKNPLLVAYNAHFDLSFLYYFLHRFNKAAALKNAKMYDVLTVYKDRRPYPHKLSDAANMYSLDMQSSHRALGDARITFELLCEMGKESDDLERYVNLFGYNPKYGVSGSKISSVTYLPQGYDAVNKLYE